MDDLIIVGAGWSGLLAALFAVQKGAKVRLIAQGIGSPIVTPGWISILNTGGDVLAAVRDLAARLPDHPYALAGADALAEAVTGFREISQKIGLPFSGALTHNRDHYTALGTRQQAALVPPGYRAEAGDSPLFVGFDSWRDYYPALAGKAFASVRLPLDRAWDATPTDLARQFDHPDFRSRVGAAVHKLVQGKNVTSVGFPAVIGLEDPEYAIDRMHAAVGLPVFEVPTLPPSVPGTRLFNKARRYLLDQGARLQVGHPVQCGLIEGGRVVGVEVAAAGKPQAFRGRAVILASGGLFGGGLLSDDRGRIWEPIFGLPVQAEADQTRWFSTELLDAKGHAVHHVGIRVDGHMRPLREGGQPLAEGLYAAGHILAHPKNGPSPLETAEGVALVTAYKAVEQALK